MIEVLKKNKIIFASACGYIIISFPVFWYLQEIVHFILAWNIILSIIPLILALFFNYYFKRLRKLHLIILFVLWLLFFPNTFYILTDFIHLGGHDFYIGNSYIKDIKLWVKLFHIVYAVIIGSFAGLWSLYYIHEAFQRLKFSFVYIFAIIVLSVNGIYIGRFLRFNSWDIFRPILLFKGWINSLDIFAFQFMFLYSVFIIIGYTIFYIYMRKVNEKNL